MSLSKLSFVNEINIKMVDSIEIAMKFYLLSEGILFVMKASNGLVRVLYRLFSPLLTILEQIMQMIPKLLKPLLAFLGLTSDLIEGAVEGVQSVVDFIF